MRRKGCAPFELFATEAGGNEEERCAPLELFDSEAGGNEDENVRTV